MRSFLVSVVILISSIFASATPGQRLATFQLGGYDAALEQGCGPNDLVLHCSFYGHMPSMALADKVCRQFLQRAIQKYPSQDILVAAWFAPRPGVPEYAFEKIEVYRSMGFVHKSAGHYSGYPMLMYTHGQITFSPLP